MTPRTARGRRVVLAAVLVPFVLAGCEASNNGQNALQPKSDDADTIYNLFLPIAIVAIVVGILIIAATVAFAWKFRYRAGVNENPRQVHGSTKLEIGWTILPFLVLAVIAVPTVSTIFKLAEDPGPQALSVTVTGKQWWWEFQYTGEKVVTANELVIPAKRPVELRLTACSDTLPGECNVIHSFWVPELAGKRDVVPGHDNRMRLQADTPGTYLGQCAEYCGLSHANMRFRVIVMTPEDFDQWLVDQQAGPVEEVADADGKALDGVPTLLQKFRCANCHLFDKSNAASYGPNLTHVASRSTFASGTYELNRENLVKWLLDAPSMVPMQSKECRLGFGPDVTCVGMPSFTKNTPPGEPVMTPAEATEIAEFLLGQK